MSWGTVANAVKQHLILEEKMQVKQAVKPQPTARIQNKIQIPNKYANY